MDSKTPKIRFAVLSDLHMTHGGYGMPELVRYLSLFSGNGPKVDAHLFAGDIVYQIDLPGGGVCDTLYPEVYDYLRLNYERYAADIPLLYTIGNHEYPQHCKDEALLSEARELFCTKTARPLNVHTVLNGYHFIVAGIRSFYCDFTRETEEWAIKEIRHALKASGNLPVFVLFHPAIPGTVANSTDAAHSERFKKFLLSDRRIINICGHLHLPANSPLSLYQRKGGGTVIHSPMSGVGNVDGMGSDCPSWAPGRGSYAAHYYEVDGGHISVHTYSLVDGAEHGEPWIIDVNGEQYYTESRFRRAKRPHFLPGAKAKATAVADGIHFSFPLAVCEPLPGNHDSIVPCYRLSFFRKGEKEPCKTVTCHSDFFLCNPPEAFDKTVAVSLEKGDYHVKISPVSFFGKTGAPLRTSFTVK